MAEQTGALARVQYESDGTTTVYSLPFPYISRDDVHVSIDGVRTYDFTFLDGSTVNLDTAPATGLIIDILRATERKSLLVEFNDGSTLLESDLTLAAQQSFFIAQEAFDQTGSTLAVADDGSYSASSRRISTLGYPVNPEDASTMQYVDNIFAQGYDAYEQANIATDAANTSVGARDAAQAAEATTLNYRNTTEQHKLNAASSASAASTSETNAANSATAAKASEDDVAANALAAQNAETLAKSHRDDASASASSASSSASSANTSAVNADDSEAKASQWAEWNEDQTVEPGKYSAKHHAIKASDSSAAAGMSEGNAADSASAASTSEQNTATSEQNTATSESNADAYQTEAGNWANLAEDILVPEGDGVDDYSALHWSRKAEGWAAGVNMPSATGNAGRHLQQKDDESGFKYVDAPYTQAESDGKYAQLSGGTAANFSVSPQVDGNDVVDKALETGWLYPTLQNGWENHGESSFVVARYRRDANGYIHLSGLVRNGEDGTTVFTLPSGMRPYQTMIYSVTKNSEAEQERVDVRIDGDVKQNRVRNAAWLSLDDIPPFYPDGS